MDVKDSQIKMLGQLLGECIIAAGIVRPDSELSGPQLLLFGQDLKEYLERINKPKENEKGWQPSHE